MIPNQYLNAPELLKGTMLVESCANGKSDEGFLGDLSLTRKDGSFHKDALPSQDVLNRLYMMDVLCPSMGNQNGIEKLNNAQE